MEEGILNKTSKVLGSVNKYRLLDNNVYVSPMPCSHTYMHNPSQQLHRIG